MGRAFIPLLFDVFAVDVAPLGLLLLKTVSVKGLQGVNGASLPVFYREIVFFALGKPGNGGFNIIENLY